MFVIYISNMYSRDESKEEEISSLRFENAFIFSPPSAASLIDNRQMKTTNFNNLQYDFGSTLQCTVNSGSDMIWGPSSYIRLEYTVTAGTTAADPNKLPNLGYGSIMNIFKNARLSHRSGESLEIINNVNVVAQNKRMWGTSLEDRQKLDGMLMGEPLSAIKDQYNSGSQRYLSAGTHVACIPLKYLFGVFDNESQFIPNSLLAGCKLELEMENPAVAFSNWTAFAVTPGATSGNISGFKPTLVLDSAQIFQSLQKQLLAEQSNVEDSGLAFTYTSWYTQTSTVSAGAPISMDIQQAATLCEKVTTVCRLTPTAAPALPIGTFDQFQFLLPYAQYQYKLGNLQYPQQMIRVPNTASVVALSNDAQEVYANALIAWSGYPSQYHKSMMKGCSVSMYPSPFDGVVAVNALSGAALSGPITDQKYTPVGPSFTTSAGAYATTLEKSPNGLSMTGLATNNSRLLNVQLQDPAADALAVQVVACLCYIRVAHLMGDNCVVDR
jgi:hypothetical protein